MYDRPPISNKHYNKIKTLFNRHKLLSGRNYIYNCWPDTGISVHHLHRITIIISTHIYLLRRTTHGHTTLQSSPVVSHETVVSRLNRVT